MPPKRLPCRSLIAAAFAGAGTWAHAHSVGEHAPDSAWLMWSTDPWVIASLIAATLLYARGVRRLRGNTRRGAGVPMLAVVLFYAGIASLVVALLSPVDALGTALFSMHMVQHEVLMLIAAPLLVAGRPLAVFVWAFRAPGRKRIGRIVRSPGIAVPWRFLSQPLAAWAIHAVVLWAWHFPALFQASLADDTVHTIQHLSFLASALLFWSSMIGTYSQWQRGSAVVSLLTTAIHTGMLGALLTFSPRVWYPAYLETSIHWGYTALEDQQLGGLIMWVPAGFLFIIAGLVFAAMVLVPGWHGGRPAASGD